MCGWTLKPLIPSLGNDMASKAQCNIQQGSHHDHDLNRNPDHNPDHTIELVSLSYPSMFSKGLSALGSSG